MPKDFSGSKKSQFSRLDQKRRVISAALCPRWNFSHSNRINFVMFAEGMACLNGD